MLSVEDWAEIRRLHFAEGMGVKTIANDSALRATRCAPPSAAPIHRPIGAAGGHRPVDAFEPEIRKLLKDCPTMPATVIAERVGWERGITVLKERVAELRPLFFQPDPSSEPTIVPVSSPSGICGSRRPISMSATATPPASR